MQESKLEIGTPIVVTEGWDNGRQGFVLATNARQLSEDGPTVLLYLPPWRDKDRIVSYSQRGVAIAGDKKPVGVDQLVTLIRNSNDAVQFATLAAQYEDSGTVAHALAERAKKKQA